MTWPQVSLHVCYQGLSLRTIAISSYSANLSTESVGACFFAFLHFRAHVISNILCAICLSFVITGERERVLSCLVLTRRLPLDCVTSLFLSRDSCSVICSGCDFSPFSMVCRRPLCRPCLSLWGAVERTRSPLRSSGRVALCRSVL